MRSTRNVRTSPDRSSSAMTYHSPRIGEHLPRDDPPARSPRRGRRRRSRCGAARGLRSPPSPTRSTSSGLSSSILTPDGVVLAERPRQLGEAAGRARRPGRRPAAPSPPAPRRAARTPSDRVEPQRPGEQPRHADERSSPSSMNTSISSSTNGGRPHIAASSRSPTTSLSVRSKRSATSRHRHLAALHQPRQHHEQPSQALLRAAAGRSSPHRFEPVDDVGAHVRGREHLGVLDEAEQPRPERRQVGARHLDLDRAVVVRATTRGPRRARAPRHAARSRVDADPGHRHRLGGADQLGIVGERRARVEPGGPFERAARRSTRRRPRCGRCGTCAARCARGRSPIRYQNPSRSSSPYGSTVRSTSR